MIVTEGTKNPETLDPNFDISDIPITSLIPLSDHYHSDNRKRLLETMKGLAENFDLDSIALFKGHYHHSTVFDSDCTAHWVPEWNFHYLFGMKDESDCYAILDFKTLETTLVIKHKTEETLIFEGGACLEDDPKIYGFDKIISVNDLEQEVRQRNAQKIYTMKGKIRDELSTYASFPWLDQMPQLDEKWLYAAISVQRSIKSDEEMV
jgi:hypothetical protein